MYTIQCLDTYIGSSCIVCSERNLCSGGVRFTGGTLNIPASLTTQRFREFVDSGSVPKLCVIYACHKCVNVVLAIMYTHV